MLYIGLTLLCIVGYLWAFFYLYILVMGIYRAYLANRLNGFLLVLCAVPVILGAIVDVLANIFIATLVFRKLPRQWLVTTRLKQIQDNPLEHQHNKALAHYICSNMLDIFDPTGDHC